MVIVYTTTPLVSFEVTRIGKSISDRVFTSFLSHSPYEIVWKHNIRVSKLDYDTNGPYVIKIRNEDGDTAEQTFTIKKAKGTENSLQYSLQFLLYIILMCGL